MPYYLKPIFKTSTEDMSDELLWEHYEKCLQHNDWTADFSDDFGVARAGRDSLSYINAIRKRLQNIDGDRASKLYWKYSFWHNDDGTHKKF